MKRSKKLKSPANKGKGFERELVNYINTYNGLHACRMWGSNGESKGLHKDVDLVMGSYVHDNGLIKELIPKYELLFQCKRLKSIPKYLGLTEHVDATLFRENSGETKVLIALDKFLELLK